MSWNQPHKQGLLLHNNKRIIESKIASENRERMLIVSQANKSDSLAQNMSRLFVRFTNFVKMNCLEAASLSPPKSFA